MRGGRNKFGPIYRRDRALRRQIRSQLHADSDLELVATATLGKADLEAIAKAAAAATMTTSKRPYNLGGLTSSGEVDVKPDVAELCGLVTGRDGAVSTSGYLRQQQEVCSSAHNLPSTAASPGKSSSTPLYPTTSSSDPLTGLSGMAAALLAQFFQQQRAMLPGGATNVTSSSSSVYCQPSAVDRSITTVPAQYSDVQRPFNSRLTTHPATPAEIPVMSVVRTTAHPATPRQYVMTQTASSAVSGQRSVIPSLCVRPPPDVSHVRPAASHVRPIDSHVSTSAASHVGRSAASRSAASVSSIQHVRPPDVSHVSLASHVRPGDSHVGLAASHVGPSAVSQSAASVSSVQRMAPAALLTSSSPSLELSGVPATLRLIFDLKRQTSSSSSAAGGSRPEAGDRLRRFAEELLQQPVSGGVTSNMETAIRRAVGLACRVCDRQLFVLVDWARQAHFFRHLSVNSSRPVFEKTCEATQKDVKSHVFLDLKKRTCRPTQPIVSPAT